MLTVPLQQEFLIPETSKEKLFKCISRDELIESCQKLNIQIKKSSNKKSLLESLETQHSGFLHEYAKNYKIVKINENYVDTIRVYEKRTYEMRLIFIFIQWYAQNRKI